MIDAIATITGHSDDINCWSGIPYHFWQAARARGEPAAPWRPGIKSFGRARWRWNLGQMLRGRGMGGYQYSHDFLDRAEATIPAKQWLGRVFTFDPYFPRGRNVTARGGRLVHYIDATFASLCIPGGLAGNLPAHVRASALALEQENYSSSERVVTMARWAAGSVIRDCGVPPTRVATILPGANLELPPDYAFSPATGKAGRNRPLVLGFVGKDWKRKGLPFLLNVRTELERMGISAVIRCAGHCPADLRRTQGLEYAGFIDKAKEPGRFVEFLAGCDVGCLFSEREPLGISTLEFLRAGVPVTGFMIEGVADTVPPDAGFRFEPNTPAEAVALTLRTAFSDESTVEKLRAAAQTWSHLVTWDRCVEEWRQLLTMGSVKCPVRPWLGLKSRE